MANQPQNSQERSQNSQPQAGGATERKEPNFNNNNNAGKSAGKTAGDTAGRDNRSGNLTKSDRNGVEPEKPENLGHDPKFDNIQAGGRQPAQRSGKQTRD
jgi:hypothetical protein